jgi:DNA-binding LytR/AlgR family response regulator
MIVDDEPLAIEVLAAHIARVETLELTARCDTADRAFSVLQKETVDLLFLDIEMPGMTGLSLLRALRRPPAVVITTAHRNYAVEGFELDVVDYLMKPISFERFLRAVEKFHSRRIPASRVVPYAEGTSVPTYVLLRADRKVHKIALSEILFFASDADYVHVHTKTRRITTRMTIGELERMLPGQSFLRIHRGVIVAIDSIDAFTSHSVEIGKHELTIGRNYRDAVLRVLQADPRTP